MSLSYDNAAEFVLLHTYANEIGDIEIWELTLTHAKKELLGFLSP